MKTPKEIGVCGDGEVQVTPLSEFLKETFDEATREEIQAELERARAAANSVPAARVDEDDEVFSPPGGSYRNVEWVPNKQLIKGR